jgi:hypothetical protein
LSHIITVQVEVRDAVAVAAADLEETLATHARGPQEG